MIPCTGNWANKLIIKFNWCSEPNNNRKDHKQKRCKLLAEIVYFNYFIMHSLTDCNMAKIIHLLKEIRSDIYYNYYRSYQSIMTDEKMKTNKVR